MKVLFEEDFGKFKPGPLPCDFSATGEYHYVPPAGYVGPWYDPIRGLGRRNEPWMVVEDDGRHRLLQTSVDAGRGSAVLVTGEPAWTDVDLRVALHRLRPGGTVGLCIRYRSSRSHYLIAMEGGKGGDFLRMVRVAGDGREVLGECRLEGANDALILAVRAEGPGIEATSCFFDSVTVTASDDAHAVFVRTRDERERELDELRERFPAPVPAKKIDTKGFGVGRQIRFGHLVNTDQLDILLAQNIKLMPGSDSLTTVRCLTALDLDGNVLRQFGEPGGEREAGMVTCDVPVQIYDIDGDARDEIALWDMERFWIYTQDSPLDADRIYAPVRYPHYNASNYRAEISLPHWEDV